MFLLLFPLYQLQSTIFVTQTSVTLLFRLCNIYVTMSIQQLVVDVNSKMKGGEKMKANKDIRDMLEEKGFHLWELAFEKFGGVIS